MIRKVPDYWDTDVYRENAEKNIRYVDKTIADLKFKNKKILVCGRGTTTHPNFLPRFSTPTTNIDSNLYVTVDHSPSYARFITRKGNYAICLIVNPEIPKKILELGGDIYWFSPEYLDYKIPKIFFGKNSGLAAIALSSYFGAKYVLISGIILTGQYNQFSNGAKLVFEQINKQGTKIFSLEGNLVENITFKKWCNL